ncbi:RDD family protein [Solitalea longa]|uniref:RDD family protein n=1 Tax=Solitalea longa TaxID=2079460 RepID=A0A2S4ZYV9_9SPHI|nr:RDD family protein [Solitalea longa]POY35187.1 RDD family protein [Solitalea longa]
MDSTSTQFQTFEQAQASQTFAGFGIRLIACILDSIILSILYGIVFSILISFGLISFSLADIGNLENNPLAILAIISAMSVFVLLAILGSWLYHALLTSSGKQGTIGKQILGIKVVDMDGNRISFARATGRYFSVMITNLIPLFIGYLLALFTDKKQALHDMIAGTVVLNK